MVLLASKILLYISTGYGAAGQSDQRFLMRLGKMTRAFLAKLGKMTRTMT